MTPLAADQTCLAGLTVLYVEDEAPLRSVTAEFLERWVGRLVLAENGLQGLALFRAEHPHIVISDIQMPHLDGLAMVEAIKAEQPGIPVIITTAFEKPNYFLSSIALGVDRYVLKPFQSTPLREALLHCAHLLRAEAELRRQLQVEHELLLTRHHEAMCILAQGMAHDYNNLQQGILATISVAMLKAQPGSPVHITLGMSKRFTDLAQELGQRLLVLGHHDIEQLDQVGSIIPVLEETLQVALPDSGVEVVLRIPPDLPPLRYNHKRLTQALGILVTNAWEAMPEGGTLQIDASLLEVTEEDQSATLGPGSYLRLSFQDSGRGIPPADLPRIFEPYFSTKEVGSRRGQGLSLALCRAIIGAHGGSVTAAPLESGSVLQVLLPVAAITP